LIVDDDRDLLLGLGIQLRAAGYEVVTAGDAVTAVSSAIRHEPDLILLDLGLPAGDGTLVLARFKSMMSLASIPVIVITAREASFEEKTLRIGATAFFQKPVDQDDLFATIAMVLEDTDHAANA
jgi:two-component system KDP operon response regulator KdpE